MDTVGLDENNAPVILEYKRGKNDSVLSQGLFYLDWLLNHRGDFLWLVQETLGEDRAKKVDWSAPRLLIIAESFNRYDLHAVNQIDRNIELYQYYHFTGSLIALERIGEEVSGVGSVKKVGKTVTTTQAPTTTLAPLEPETPQVSNTVEQDLQKAQPLTQEIFEALRDYILTLDADVQLRFLKPYFAFRKLNNFLTGSPYKGKAGMLVWLRLNPDGVDFSHYPGVDFRDMRGTEHAGTGDLQIYLSSLNDLEAVLPLIDRAYHEAP